MTSVRPVPSTQRRRQPCPGYRIVRELNQEYNLGLHLGDPDDPKDVTFGETKNPARRDQIAQQWHQIVDDFRSLYYQRVAERAVLAFRREARAVSLNWVHKPRADPDLLPSSAEPFKARTPGEQVELQNLLIEQVKKVKELKQTPEPALPAQAETRGLDIFARSNGTTRGKRQSTELVVEIPRGASKRRKSHSEQTRAISVYSSIDKVPLRQKATLTNKGSSTLAAVSPSRTLYTRSDNTSKSSLQPSIFSRSGNDRVSASQQTQTTVENDSHPTPKPLRQPFPPSSNDLFAPSSSDIEALDVSFSRLVEEQTSQDADDIPSDDPRQWAQPEPQLPAIPHRIVTQDEGEYTTTSSSTKHPSHDVSLEVTTPVPEPRNSPLNIRLTGVWPSLPLCLSQAPMCVIWEVTRICVHCDVAMDSLKIDYEPSWQQSIGHLWAGLRTDLAFLSKSFPEPPSDKAWEAARNGGFRLRNDAVVLSASLDFNCSKEGPLLRLRMNPLRLEKSCRLNRRFGADRFLEILLPQVHGKDVPEDVKQNVDEFIHWLTRSKHSILGRRWSAFSTQDGGKWKPVKDLWMGKEPSAIFKERIHLFAENTKSESGEALPVRTAAGMLDWLLHFERNKGQPYLKLFSRIQLGLSKTDPTIVLEEAQIIHHAKDLRSPSGKVMNDGIGRMSLGVARKVQQLLGLSEIPSAVQARLGPAKGMWIVDLTGRRPGRPMGLYDLDDLWIETYPSQRKWECDQTDPHQRTLEINGRSHELKSASLNLQFLPILEDRAKNKMWMRETIGKRMVDDLSEELKTLRVSMSCPVQFKREAQARSGSLIRAQRVEHGHVPFLGGLPKEPEEAVSFLLDGGFDPKKLRYLQDLAWDLVNARAERLKTKLNIRIGRSAYIYMIVDFWEILEEGEVHVCFSSKFEDERSGFNDVLLHDIDILVARSPAHLVSDVQKVRAVFKHELRHLKDVIVFSAKGNEPLADKLSGGDYDGDKAWVCWDEDIVNNFQNAPVPNKPDHLARFLEKDKTTFGDLLQQARLTQNNAIAAMIEGSFRFNMGQSLLGICTNYKERLCYHRNTVNDQAALLLSSLLSELVDQPKQGVRFDMKAWNSLKQYLRLRDVLPEPAYKSENWSGRGEPRHIIDYIKFSIVKPTIDKEREAFAVHLKRNSSTQFWDPDLVQPYQDFKDHVAEGHSSCREILSKLHNRLGEVEALWSTKMSKDKERDASGFDFSARVTEVYHEFLSIQPDLGHPGRAVKSKVVHLLTEPYLGHEELSRWNLLKASYLFRLYHRSKPKMVWRLCGRQLQAIKASMARQGAGAGPPISVTPLMYAALTVDKKFVARYVARDDGKSTQYFDDDDDDELGDF